MIYDKHQLMQKTGALRVLCDPEGSEDVVREHWTPLEEGQ